MSNKHIIVLAVVGVIAFLGLIGGSCYVVPKYGVWEQSLAGEAELRKAEYSKQVAVEEAKALMESAGLKSQAEVERAKGVAEANKIIGDSLQNNDAYLRYLWIQGLHDGSSEVIYIPTEGNLPIMEATRRLSRPTPKAVPAQ